MSTNIEPCFECGSQNIKRHMLDNGEEGWMFCANCGNRGERAYLDLSPGAGWAGDRAVILWNQEQNDWRKRLEGK